VRRDLRDLIFRGILRAHLTAKAGWIDLEGVNGASQAPAALRGVDIGYWIEGSRSRTSPPTRLELSDFIMRRFISPQD
jgi:hypothetical protein